MRVAVICPAMVHTDKALQASRARPFNHRSRLEFAPETSVRLLNFQTPSHRHCLMKTLNKHCGLWELAAPTMPSREGKTKHKREPLFEP